MSALQKTLRLIGRCAMPMLARQGVALRRSLVVAVMVISSGSAFAGAGPNTSLPFEDTFEIYTNGTLLNSGTNGWYGSSTNIIVISNMTIGATGTNSALIPVDCILSNRFTGIPRTNVWLQMSARPQPYNVTNPPLVDTNVACMFYINSNGNFVVHNGPTSDPTNSAYWVTLTNGAINTNGETWVTIGIYEDFTRKKWDLYTNGVMVTNNVKFVNSALTNFPGFDVYNGAETSYLDNVSVVNSNRTVGHIGLSAATLTFSATYGSSPNNQTVVMTNSGQSAFTYSNTVTYGSGSGWLTVTPAVDDLAGNAGQVLTFAVNSAALALGVYVATNTISSPNADADNAPQTIVTTLHVVYAPTPPTTNSIPWSDDFEDYTNLTPLVSGIHGWYGSSTGIVVQQSVVKGGLQSAMIPVDCTLSNPFVPATPTNVWIQMEARPNLFDGTNTPIVDTNQAVMFYINTGGYFVVHNGPASNPTNSANWVTLTNSPINNNGTTWVTIGIYEDYTRKKWDLYTNGTLVTNNIKFVNSAFTNFLGFNVYEGTSTSYLDNISVTASNRSAGYIGLGPVTLTYSAFYTPGTSNQTQEVIMTNLGASAFTYSNTVTYGSGSGWLTVTPNVGELAGNATQGLACVVDSGSMTVGVYVATNTISSPNGDATNAPKTIVATLTVSKATATVTLNNLSQTYNGSARIVTATTEPSGLMTNITYDGNSWAPTNAGSYAVTGIVVDANYQGTNNGTLVVGKASLTATLVPTIYKVFDGNAVATLGYTNYALTGLIGTETSAINQTVGTYDTTNAGVNIGVTATLASTNFPEGVNGFSTNNYSLPASASGNVGEIGKANQTISFPAIPAQPYTNGTLALSASASSGLTVTFAVLFGGPGTIAGSNLTFTSVGSISIEASQAGNANWYAAGSKTNTFPIYGFNPTTNHIPWSDNFETYIENEPLINGTNGWYGSSADIIVQTNIVATGIYITATGTNAALIPVDCTLSNRFVAGIPANVRIAMDLRPVRYEGTNFPAVNTNDVASFYVDTNGHFVVCNWLGTTSSWCMVSNAVGSGSEFIVSSNTWAHIVIYLDYRHRNWKLKANNILITNKIGFVTQQTNSLSMLDVYNGSTSTSYLDNVSVNWWDRFKVNGVLDHLIRSVNGIIPDRIMGVPAP